MLALYIAFIMQFIEIEIVESVMGHIYSPEEYSSKQIPSLNDYDSARLQLTQGLRELVSRKVLYGAVFLGSVTYSDLQIGSDIDLFIVMESKHAELNIRDLASNVTRLTNVHFDIKAVKKEDAQMGHHNLLYFYVKTTKDFCSDWIIGNDPTSVIAPRSSWSDVQSEVRDNLIIRVDALINARVRTESDYSRAHCDFLDRLLTLPIYTAINMVRLKYDGQPAISGKRLSKEDTCKLYEQVDPCELSIILHKLILLKKRYRNALSSQDIGVNAYMQLLNEIDIAYPLALDFIEENCNYLFKTRLAPKN